MLTFPTPRVLPQITRAFLMDAPMTPLTDRVFSLEFTENMLSCLEPTLGMEKRRGLIPQIAAAI